MTKPKVLCVCAKGQNRSKYLAKYLKEKGYATRFGGVDLEGTDGKELRQKDVDWAEVIVIVRKRLVKIFRKKFGKLKKKIIVLDVSDSKKSLPKKMEHLKKLDSRAFHKIWTYPRLRSAIKPYLPLKK